MYSQKHLLESENKLNDSELFCLIIATWLHDIGGMGGGINDKDFLTPDRARKEHPFNGGRIVLDDGTLFLDLADDEQSAIADIVVSHSSRVELKQLQPKMVCGNSVRTELLAVLLSLADAFDTQESRVGGFEEVKLKLHKLELLKNKLEGEMEKVERQLSPDEEKLTELRADVEYIGAQKEHHYKHLSVKKVFFTPASIILEKKILTLSEYEKYFTMALSDVQKEFERVKAFFSKYKIMLQVVRAFDKSKDNVEALYKQIKELGVSSYEQRELLDKKIEFPERRKEVRQLIETYERDLRKFIKVTLHEKFEENWWEKRIPSKIRDVVNEEKTRRQRNISPFITSSLPEDDIAYTTLDQLKGIILTNKKEHMNWADVYEDYFKNKNDTQSRLDGVREIRNLIAHGNPVSKVDLIDCEVQIRKFIRIISKVVECETDISKEIITEPKEPTEPKEKTIPLDKSILFEVTTLNTLHELTRKGNFLEKPLKEEEWKSKREEVITFNERAIEDAISKLTTHRILLISGQPNVGKSTFLLFFLDKCLERGIKDWSTVIFLNSTIKEKDFDSVLEDVNTFIQSKYGQNNVLLAIDGLHRRESDKNYVNKCHKLFEKASHSGYKIIATLRDSEKEFLKNKLENLDEWDIDEWAKLEPIMEEIKLTYKTEELKMILVKYLNHYREKIKLQNVSFDDMNMYVREAVNIPPEKIEQYQRFNECMEIVVKKSEGLAGYIAFLIKEIAEHEGEFSKEIVKKYPIGMVNIILNTIWRDYYVENDDLIPLFIIFLTKLTELDDPVNYMTTHFFDSFKMWGIEVLDKELEKEVKEKILKKIENFVNSFTIRTTFLEEDKYSLLNYWNDAIEEAIHKGNYDKGNKNYNRIVDEFKDAEKNWKYLIKDNYIPLTVNQLENRNETFFSGDLPRSDVFYIVGDIAKLWRITDPNVLDFSTAFFKEYRQKYAESLPLQFDFLKKTLSLLWRMKAQDFLEIWSYDPAIASYKEAIETDNDDYRSYWEIGGCYEKKGEKHKALDCYTESANKQGTSKGYGVLASKVSEYRKEYCKKQEISEDFELRYLESQENAATNAINCVGGEREHRNWGILGEALQRKGLILSKNEKYLKAIPMFEQAIMAYEEAMNVMIGLKQVPKDWYHWQIGYCHKDLAFTYNKLENLDEAKKNLKMAIDNFKFGAEHEDCTKGYLKLAELMSREDFYSIDNSACKEALEKIDVNELGGDGLVEYYWLWGKDYEIKQDFENALNKFNEAKNLIFSKYISAMDISVQDEEEDTHELIDDLYQHIGSCYEKMRYYNNRAAENYMVYADLDEYTPKGLSGELYGIYGNKFLGWKFYKEAQHCFWKALKRNPKNAKNLSQRAYANAKLGHLNGAISDLEKALNINSSEIRKEWSLSNPEKDRTQLSEYMEMLESWKHIASILESICSIVDTAIKGANREEQSIRWYLLFTGIKGLSDNDTTLNWIGGDTTDLMISSLQRSISLNTPNPPAEQAMKKLTKRSNWTDLPMYTKKYHNDCAESLKNENRSPVLEIFHRIFSATIDTTSSIHTMNIQDIRAGDKKRWMKNLSREWGLLAGRINEINKNEVFTSKIPYNVAVKCLELSLKLNEKNVKSLSNLGWRLLNDKKFDDAIKAFEDFLKVNPNNYDPIIGLGKAYEGKGDAESALKWLKEGAALQLEFYRERDPKKGVNSLIETAESIKNLNFLDISKDEEITILKDALEVYEQALEISMNINPTDPQTLLLREKVRLLEKQIMRAETIP